MTAVIETFREDATALVFIGDDGEPFTTSLVIAHETDVQHKNVLEVIRANLADLNEVGRVAFQTQPFDTAGGTQNREVALLDETAAALLMTYSRNTPVVKAFKKRLVGGFYAMRKALADRPKTTLSGPELMAAALVEANKVLELRERTIAAQAEQLALDAPKVRAYEALMDADGTYSIAAAAQILGTGQNRLFAKLREARILIPTAGARYNTPYQEYAHLFDLKASSFKHSNGRREATYTTKVRPSGLEFIAKKIGVLL